MAPNGGGVPAIIDDNSGVGRPADIFPANAAFAADLALVGLDLQPAKRFPSVLEYYMKLLSLVT